VSEKRRNFLHRACLLMNMMIATTCKFADMNFFCLLEALESFTYNLKYVGGRLPIKLEFSCCTIVSPVHTQSTIRVSYNVLQVSSLEHGGWGGVGVLWRA
jgi:hypothetical protein